MDQIIYKIGDLKRPGFSFLQRKLLYLNKLPLVRGINLFKRIIFKIYDIPLTTEINKDFQLSAPNIKVGKNVGLGDTFILAYAPVEIGDNCSFSFRNIIITSTHDLNDFSTVIGRPVTIGKNVWITTNVTILPGVSIGDNSIIGAGSVVVNDIPAGVLAAGNPCKVIKNITFNK